MTRRRNMLQHKKRALVQTLLGLQNHQCAKFGHGLAASKRPGVRLPTLDHVIPVAKGGNNWFANFVLLCGPCNLNKGSNFDSDLVAACKRIWQPIIDDKIKRGQQITPRKRGA
jgi:5-methylcytosine-specific restriction endonuclease McrA